MEDISQSCNLRALKALESLDVKMTDIKGKAMLDFRWSECLSYFSSFHEHSCQDVISVLLWY